MESIDEVSRAAGLGNISDMLGPKEVCEFCTHDSPCRMHYVEYTKKNAVELRQLEINENF